MTKEFYDAKQVSKILKMSVTSVYRKAKLGDIPSVGKRPNIQFPKEAIDALAEVNMGDGEEEKLTFTVSTIAESWTKKEIKRPYEDEDTVPFKTVLEWRKRNNDITMNLKKGDKILGWTTFLPLEEEVIMELVYDRIREKEIPPTAVKKWNDPDLTVYIPVVEVISSGQAEQDRRNGMYLLRRSIKWAITLSIEYDIKKWYGLGVTPEGQRLLEATGFRIMHSSQNGERKGYVLEGKSKPVRLISRFLASLEAQTSTPEESSN